MIVTVNPNPNVDRLLKVSGFRYGSINRIDEKMEDVTSKGMNVSIALKRLGLDTLCTGFMYEKEGEKAVFSLEREGIAHDYVWQPGSMRVNLKILDTQTGVITEVNDRGVHAGSRFVEDLKKKVPSFAHEGDVFVLNGSMPPGCGGDLFAGLIEACNARGARCVLDAEGEALKKGVQAMPYLVKINRHELATYAGRAVRDDNTVLGECERMLDEGVTFVAVSLGRDGAIITDGNKAYKSDGVPIKPVSATGAGDAMTAGIVKGLLQDAPLDEMLRMGTAAATATVLCEGTQMMTASGFRKMYRDVRVRRL